MAFFAICSSIFVMLVMNPLAYSDSLDRCGVIYSDRSNCGLAGEAFNQTECEDRGCCFDGDDTDSPHVCWIQKQILHIPVNPVTNDAKKCHFPFLYGGYPYFECTMDDSPAVPWCGTTYDYDTDQELGHCLGETCRMSSGGAEYIGTVAETLDGRPCQAWSSQIPTIHFETDPELFPDATLEDASNYCRNPDGYDGPWCYFADSDPSSWDTDDLCTIPTCDETGIFCNEYLLTSDVSFQSTNISAGTVLTINYIKMDGVGAYCSEYNTVDDWLQVDFSSLHKIWGIVLQGDGEDSWTTTFMIQTSSDGDIFLTYQEGDPLDDKIFDGNTDVDGYVAYQFGPVFTTHVRIYSLTWSTNQCFRFDLVGCIDTNECDTNPCLNNADCRDLTDGYQCICQAGWRGNQCDIEIDECEIEPCFNGGTCTDLVGSFSCACETGYSGDDCSTGSARSCVDLALGGFTKSGYYMLDLYNELLPENLQTIRLSTTCLDCMELSGWRKVSCRGCKNIDHSQPLRSRRSMHAVGGQKAKSQENIIQSYGCSFYNPNVLGALANVDKYMVSIPDPITIEACELQCLSDPECVGYNFLSFISVCELITAFTESTYTAQLSAGTIGIKQCNDAVAVHCNFTNVLQPITTITTTSDKKKQKGPSQYGAGDFNSAGEIINYYPVTVAQMRAVINDSMSCTQHMYLHCIEVNAEAFTMGAGDGNEYDLYDPVFAVAPETCSCWTGVCFASRCKCDDKPDWRKDKVDYPKKEFLPILYYLYGDVDYWSEVVYVYFGPLICTGSTLIIDECDSDPCMNGGTCTDSHFSYMCDCPIGFSGGSCEININECASNPCFNDAICLDAVNQYSCQCLDGFEGVHCETDINECVSSPCSNGASCVDLVNQFSCSCKTGYVGEYCEVDVNECLSQPCDNSGSCSNNVGYFSCDCTEAYEGVSCQQEIDECASEPCQNGGDCTDLLASFGCECPLGYEGTQCETNIDECSSAPCLNGGECMDEANQYSCSCQPGYEGIVCQLDSNECESSPCLDGGSCEDQLNGYICNCVSGFQGDNCEEVVDLCLSTPCSNGAQCRGITGGIECLCQAGYSGDYCEIDNDECASNPCYNNGQCVDGVNEMTCLCEASYSGAFCQYVKIDGQWSGWGEWTDCSTQCGTGVRTMMRQCTNPAPQHGGQPCSGDQAMAELCYSEQCVNVDGNWGMWESWGRCSVTCNTGVRARKRTCSDPPALGTGLPCPGDDTSSAYCTERRCGEPVDGRWSTWTAWSSCSSSCGVGVTERTRACSDPPAVYGGEPCKGEDTNNKPCMDSVCPAFEDCSEWGVWSPCSRTCGDGMHTRSQTCRQQQRPSTGDTEQVTSEPTDAVLLYHDVTEYEHEHCEDTKCGVPECYFCNSTYDGTVASLTCKGPTKPCPEEQPYCMYMFDTTTEAPGLQKGCASHATCSAAVSDTCSQLWDETIDAIISESKLISGPLEPHPDTLARMWDSLQGGTCRMCCTKSRCNRGSLPPGNSIFNTGNRFGAGGLLVIGCLWTLRMF